MDKKNRVLNYVKFGFWAMLALFVLTILFSVLSLQIVSDISSVLFAISLMFVFVNSIRYVAPPEKAFAYVALGITILLVLFLLMLIFAMALGGNASGASSSLGSLR